MQLLTRHDIKHLTKLLQENFATFHGGKEYSQIIVSKSIQEILNVPEVVPTVKRKKKATLVRRCYVDILYNSTNAVQKHNG